MSVYLAVDAGGTKTECVLADEERVLARVTGGTIKIVAIGAAEATSRFRSLLAAVSEQAGIPLYLVTRACVGLTGVSQDGVRPWAESILSDLLTGELLLTGDEEIALEAAFGEGPGVLVMAGTGSHAVGRCSDGSRFTAGGWGPMLGDEGSGHWIGLEGIRSGLRALDRGVPTTLLREMNSLWGIQGTSALVAKANGRPRPDYTVLAEGVARAAASGDAIARGVLERAGQELAVLVNTVLAKMRAASCASGDTARVAFTGSVLRHIVPVQQSLVQALRLSQPQCTLDAQAVDPLAGALARARRG